MQVNPRLTTVANRSDEVGVQEVQLLLGRMAMDRDQPGRIVHRPLPLITRDGAPQEPAARASLPSRARRRR
jgi:DNA-binding LacI/PurR family transcriptional regulator